MGQTVIMWYKPLSCGTNSYHVGQQLSCGTNSYQKDQMSSCGENTVLLCEQCYHVKQLLSCALQGKSHLCIPFLGIARRQSQFEMEIYKSLIDI